MIFKSRQPQESLDRAGPVRIAASRNLRQTLHKRYDVLRLAAGHLEIFGNPTNVAPGRRHAGELRKQNRSAAFAGISSRRALQVLVPGHVGKNLGQHSGFMKQAETVCRMAFGQDAGEFFANPLGAHALDFRRHAADRGPRFRFDRVTQSRAKSDRAKKSKLVFFETLAADRRSLAQSGLECPPDPKRSR